MSGIKNEPGRDKSTHFEDYHQQSSNIFNSVPNIYDNSQDFLFNNADFSDQVISKCLHF